MARLARIAGIAALLAALSSLSLSLGTARADALTIAVAPTSGANGTEVTISGQGAPALARVDILWSPWFAGESCGPQGRGADLVAEMQTDSQGRFQVRYSVHQLINYGPEPWQGVIYLAKVIPPPPDPEIVSNYACFSFNPSPSPDMQYFPQTQHWIGHGFLAYWKEFGGLAVFGYPISDELQENGLTVQYFERARFEWHPGAWPARYDVELGLLGDELTAGRTGEAPFQPAPIPSVAVGDSCLSFSATGHNLCGTFLSYWEQHGGLAVFGYPISEPFQEKPPTYGQTFTVQYFERARFESPSDSADSPYGVMLGRLGAEALQLHHPELLPACHCQ